MKKYKAVNHIALNYNQDNTKDTVIFSALILGYEEE